jgi:quinol monooxygenase YgiN
VHARVIIVAVPPDQVAEITRIYTEHILPATKAAAGNRGVLLLIDPASGRGLFITLWESEIDGLAHDTSGAYREQVAKLAQLFSRLPALATYEVAAQG